MRGKAEGAVIETRLRSRERVENLIMGSTMISLIHPFNLKKATLLSRSGASVGLGGCYLRHMTKENVGGQTLGLPFFQDFDACLHKGFGRKEGSLILPRSELGLDDQR